DRPLRAADAPLVRGRGSLASSRREGEGLDPMSAALGMPAAATARDAPSATPRPTRVAYVMSQFPKISETFVLYEMLEVERFGADVEVFPLRRGPSGPRHPEAA